MTPKQYKSRFREAMDAYFLVVPDAWFDPSSLDIKNKDNFVGLVDEQSSMTEQATPLTLQRGSARRPLAKEKGKAPVDEKEA